VLLAGDLLARTAILGLNEHRTAKPRRLRLRIPGVAAPDQPNQPANTDPAIPRLAWAGSAGQPCRLTNRYRRSSKPPPEALQVHCRACARVTV